MEWVDNSLIWIGTAVLVFLGVWFRNFLTILVPSPQRARLALKNLAVRKASARDRVRFVLGWLYNDYHGNNTTAVSATFSEIEGIELCRSATIVSASGAADEWRAAMRRKARDLLRVWDADIAVVGRVDKDGDALSLWFVSSADKDTLADSSNPYPLRLSRLPDGFVDDLRVQIRALVLTLAIPKATTGSRQQLGLQQLKAAVPKLENLFRTLSAQEDRISLCDVYVQAQSCLGEWLGETERFRLATERARGIMDGADISDNAGASLTLRVNLARTLCLLGEREGSPGTLAESLSLLERALNSVDPAIHASIAAGIEGLVANALRALARLEKSPDHLRRAAAHLESALEVHQRQAEAPFVAVSQNNLGLVYLDLANATMQQGLWERAISLFDSASRIASQENMRTLWAMAQNNTGQAHETLAELVPGSDVRELEKSRDRYEEAVCGYSRMSTPYYLASAKTNLGRVLARLGALNGAVEHLDQAIECLEDAHALSQKDSRSTSVGAASAGLGSALLTRGQVRRSARDVEKAVDWFEEALKTYKANTSPVKWVKVKTNLASSYFRLSIARNDVEAVVKGFSFLEEIFIQHDLRMILASRPEPYIAFLDGTGLVRSMVHQADYVGDWIARWAPVFTERAHEGVSRHMLGMVQNDIATVCLDAEVLTDAVKLLRCALTNESTHADTNETKSGSIAIPPTHPGASDRLDSGRLAAEIKRNLGTACRMLGEERSCERLLREAIALFDEVLAGLDPAVDPVDWAITHSSKGRAYKDLYHVQGDVEHLRRSLSAYEEASRYLVDGKDSLWHRQVPGKRDEVRRLLQEETGRS